jgi:hypothetical protein
VTLWPEFFLAKLKKLLTVDIVAVTLKLMQGKLCKEHIEDFCFFYGLNEEFFCYLHISHCFKKNLRSHEPGNSASLLHISTMEEI